MIIKLDDKKIQNPFLQNTSLQLLEEFYKNVKC